MNKKMVSLKVMAEAKTEGISKVTSFAVDPRIMQVEDGFNGRPLDPDHVEAMAKSYANGATVPALDVTVDDGVVTIRDGHHRRAGAMLAISRGAEIRTLECRHFRGNDADRVMLMITSQQGLPMTPLQLGVQYRKMVGFGWPRSQIADRAGKSAQHRTGRGGQRRAGHGDAQRGFGCCGTQGGSAERQECRQGACWASGDGARGWQVQGHAGSCRRLAEN